MLSRLALRWVLWRVERAIRQVEARARSCGSRFDLEAMFACWRSLDDLQAKRRALLNSTEALKKHHHGVDTANDDWYIHRVTKTNTGRVVKGYSFHGRFGGLWRIRRMYLKALVAFMVR